jgi:hypothetical protein
MLSRRETLGVVFQWMPKELAFGRRRHALFGEERYVILALSICPKTTQ